MMLYHTRKKIPPFFENKVITRAVETIAFISMVARAIMRPSGVSATGVFIAVAHVPCTFINV